MENERKSTPFSISSATLVKLLLFALLGYLLYLIRDVIALVFAALVIALALNPWVEGLQRWKIPRALGVILIYLAGFALFALAIILLIPPIAQQISDIVANFPQYYDQAAQAFENIRLFGANVSLKEQLAAQLSKIAELAGNAATGMLSTISSIFGGIFSFIMLLVITLYFVVTAPGLKAFLSQISPPAQRDYLQHLIERMQVQLSLWLRGQIILSIIIFLMIFLGLTIVGVKYALLLGFLAGIFEVVPLLGPIIAAIPGVFFALAQSPGKALLALIVYIVMQQLESNLISPRIMSKSVDLNPVVVIIVVLIGVKLGGIMGALLAVPVAAAGSIVVKDIIEHRSAAKPSGEGERV